jgi:hypothetical protein
MKRPLAYSSLLALVAGLTFILTINDFLAINRRVEADILVVEGWVYDHPAIAEAAEEFKKGPYRLLITVGGPVAGVGGTPERTSTAALAASQLQELGVEQRLIVALPVPEVSQHRTYASALRVKGWLQNSRFRSKGINVFTIGPHARKSLVLFTRAFGTACAVGVIAGTDEDYDANRWWMSTRGIYVISRKLLGYLYAVTWPLPEDIPVSAA